MMNDLLISTELDGSHEKLERLHLFTTFNVMITFNVLAWCQDNIMCPNFHQSDCNVDEWMQLNCPRKCNLYTGR